MTLTELHQRLGSIIEEHNARGWHERNDQPVVLRVQRPDRKRTHSIYIEIDRVASGSLGIRLNKDDEKATWVTEATGTIHKF